MLKVTHNELNSLVKNYYDKKTALFCWGTFGIGKSRVISDTAKEIAKEKKREFFDWNRSTSKEKEVLMQNPEKYFVFIDIRLSEYDSSDIKGLPDFTDNKKTIEWKIPTWAKLTAQPNSDGILFFDEINLSTPLVMGSCYKIIYDRIINESKVGDEWLIMGSGNLSSDRAFTHSIPEPLKDRAGEVELTPPETDDWIDWGIKSKLDSRIIGFLKFKSSNLHKIDFNSNQKQTTCRGWERVSHLIKDVPLKDIKLIVQSSIGEGIGQEFVSFCKIQEKLNLEEIIKNPEKIKKISDIGTKYFLITALCDRYREKKVDFEKIMKVSKVLDEIGDVEFVALFWRLALGYAEERFKEDFQKSKEDDFIKKYAKFIV